MGIKRGILLLAPASLICLSLLISNGQAKEIIILGGDQGKSWADGGGGITPVFIVGSKEVESGNTPGGVIDFNFEGRQGWIFPQKVDSTENISLEILDRGGSVTAPTVVADIGEDLKKMIDNNPSTAFERKSTELKQVYTLGVVIEIDLGSQFGVSRIKFFPRNADPDFPTPDFPFQDDFIRAYKLSLNDGSDETQSGGRPIYTTYLLELQNDQPVVDLPIVPQLVRFIKITSETTVGFEISEFQVFGQGFVPTAKYLSDILDLGEAFALLGKIRWAQDSIGDAVPSKVTVRTRSGVDSTPVVFNRVRLDEEKKQKIDPEGEEVPWKSIEDLDEGSREREIVSELDNLSVADAMLTFRELSLEERNAISLTQSDYETKSVTLEKEKGSVRDDIENWSLWTPPYSPAGIATEGQVVLGEGGVEILSPSPRRFFQIKLDFSSDELFLAKGVSALSFDFSASPLAREILAEISPRQVGLGRITEFEYSILPDMRPGVDKGFSSFQITTPVRVVSIDKIEMIFPDGTSASQDFSDADLTDLPVSRKDFSVDFVEEDRFSISFPEVQRSDIEAGEITVVRVNFRGIVLRIGTAFVGEALNIDAVTGELDISQEAVGGNVVDIMEGAPLVHNPANLVVQVPIEEELLINLLVVPNPFTPNGDGVNDFTTINYDITSLTREGQVSMGIYDLSGRLLKEVYSGNDKSGSYPPKSGDRKLWEWDGTDKGGNLLPPGTYIFRVEVNADTGTEVASEIVSVVY